MWDGGEVAEVPPREGQALLWGGWVVIVATCGDRLVMCKKGRQARAGIKGRGEAVSKVWAHGLSAFVAKKVQVI